MFKKWERADERSRERLKAYEAKAKTANLMNNAMYRTTLEKYKQEMQNWRSSMSIVNTPMFSGPERMAAFETARDQRSRIDFMEEQLDGISGTAQGTVNQPAAGETVNAAPAVGTEQDGYRFKGGDPSQPANWIKVP